MNSDEYDVIYCREDDEYRLYCGVCENACIEQFHKNHLKSQTHISNTHKRQQTKTRFKCGFFDIDMQNVSRNIYIDSHKYKKCLREKYVSNTPNFFEVDKILNDYVEGHDKNFDRYLINCEFKLK